ncbi:MAG: 2-dehydropantoate 2-reductase [Armatimonadota bacterium]
MSILIIGAGAVGQYLAGQLSSFGQSITLVEKSKQRVNSLNNEIIKVSDSGKVKVYIGSKVKAYLSFADIPVKDAKFDYIFICVKAYHLKSAMEEIITFIDGAKIVVFQNGLGNEELVAEYLDPSNIISATTTTAVYPGGNTSIYTSGKGGIGIAPFSKKASVDELYNVFGASGFAVKKYDDYKSLKWSKLLINMLGNASCGILDMPAAELFADSNIMKLEIVAFREAYSVMKKLGIKPVNLPDFPVALLVKLIFNAPFFALKPFLRKKLVKGRGDKKPSLYIELLGKSKITENEYINGAIFNATVKLGLEAPANKALYDALQDIVDNDNWDIYRGKPDKLFKMYLDNKIKT